KPLRLAIHLALGFAALGVLLLVYSIVSFFWIDHTVVGWSSLMCAIALLGAGQMVVPGIIGEYVGRILRDTRGWPIYVVAETDADQGAAADPNVAVYPHGGVTAARA